MKKWGHGRGQSDTVMYSVDPGKIKKDARSKQWPKKGKGRNNNNQYNLIWSISYVSYMKRQIRSHSTSFLKKINSFCSPPHSYISRESSLSPGPSLPLIWPAIWRVLYVLFSLCWPQNPGAPWGWRDPLAEFQQHFIVAGFWSKRGTLSGSLIWVTAADTWVFFDEKRSWSVVRPALPHRNCPPLLLTTHTPAPPQTGLLPTFSF